MTLEYNNIFALIHENAEDASSAKIRADMRLLIRSLTSQSQHSVEQYSALLQLPQARVELLLSGRFESFDDSELVRIMHQVAC